MIVYTGAFAEYANYTSRLMPYRHVVAQLSPPRNTQYRSPPVLLSGSAGTTCKITHSQTVSRIVEQYMYTLFRSQARFRHTLVHIYDDDPLAQTRSHMYVHLR